MTEAGSVEGSNLYKTAPIVKKGLASFFLICNKLQCPRYFEQLKIGEPQNMDLGHGMAAKIKNQKCV